MGPGRQKTPTGTFGAGKPAQMGREMLGTCLAGLQEVNDQSLDVRKISGHVAKAIGSLFAVQSSQPEEEAHVAGVRKAMAQLRLCLEALQDASSKEQAVHDTAATIAKVMAILYPVAKAQERASLAPATAVPAREVPHDPRRTTRRVAIEADIGFQSDTNFYTGFSEDVSEGGLFIATYDFLVIGTAIAVNFTLPNGYLVSAGGVVRWIREYNPTQPDVLPGMGVQFVELKKEDRNAIESFLRLRSPMFFEHG